MAGAINPFFNPRRSNPMSHFVDNSIPAELMLQAGLSKQKQQDDFTNALNALEFDQNALKGGDTAYKNTVQEKVNSFVDEYIGKDLTNSQAQAEIFKFARGVKQDEKLKQIANNYAAVQKYQADLAELQKAGNQAFKPIVNENNRIIQSYVNSGKEGEEFGLLPIQKALDLHAKEENYFNNIKASGGEDFINNLTSSKDLYFKKGWEAVSKTKIGQTVRNAVPDYAASSEGQQAIALYNELKQTGNLPKGVTTVEGYLADRLLRTGMEFEFGKSTKSFEKGLTDAIGEKNKVPEAPTSSPGATSNLGDLSYEEAQDIVNGKTQATEAQKLAAKSILDKSKNEVLSTPKGQELNKKIEEAGNSISNPTAKDFTSKFKEISTENILTAFGNPKTKENVQNKLGEFLGENMPEVIKEKLKSRDRGFFDDLTSSSYGGSNILDVNTADPENPFISIQGTDKKLTASDLGITNEELIENERAFLAYGNEVKSTYRKNNEGKEVPFNVRIAGMFTDDPTPKGSPGALSGVTGAMDEFDNLVSDAASGTSAQPTETLRVIDPKQKGLVEEAFRSANFNNMVATSTDNLGEKLDSQELETLLANISSGNASVRVDKENRMLEVTAKIGDEQKTFKLEEAPGLKGQDGTFDKIYEIVTGDAAAGQKVGLLGNFSKNINSSLTPLSTLGGEYSQALPTNINRNISVKLNEANSIDKNKYVLGDNTGTYTLNDLVTKLETMKDDPVAKNLTLNTIMKQAYNSGVSTEKLNTLMGMLQLSPENTADNNYTNADYDLLNDLLDNDLTADSYDEILILAKALSL